MSQSEILFEWHTDKNIRDEYELSSVNNPYARKVNNNTGNFRLIYMINKDF